MTNYAEFYNPGLEEILQSIALDPKAKMLKIPSSGELVCATNYSRVGIAAPGLTSAEVELLSVHREALGELLKQRCLMEFFAQPNADLMWHKSVTVDRRLEVREEQAWISETERISAFPFRDEKSELAADVLGQCVSGSHARPVSITQLSMAMLRVDPKDQARIYIALELVHSRRLRDAKSSLFPIIGQTSDLLASYCEDAIGHIAGLEGNTQEALEAYSRSSAHEASRLLPLMSGVAVAVEDGETSQALGFAFQLNELVSEEHQDIDDFCRSIRGRTLSTNSLLTDKGRDAIEDLLASLGNSAAGRIIHAHL